jgi:prepilin peptidase CpaA
MEKYLMVSGLLCLLFPAIYFDTRSFRIPNALTLAGCLAGLVLASYLRGWTGLEKSAAGMLAAFAIALPFWQWGWMGAGDVKLLAAVGAIMGLPLVFSVLALTAASGLVLSLLALAWHGRLRHTLAKIAASLSASLSAKIVIYYPPDDITRRIRLPYALAIAGGSFTALLLA